MWRREALGRHVELRPRQPSSQLHVPLVRGVDLCDEHRGAPILESYPPTSRGLYVTDG
jgi:hypothetical protein